MRKSSVFLGLRQNMVALMEVDTYSHNLTTGKVLKLLLGGGFAGNIIFRAFM